MILAFLLFTSLILGILISAVLYLGIIFIICSAVVITYILLSNYLKKITDDMITVYINRKTVTTSIVVALTIFLVWYYIPREPVKISKDEVSYFTINSYINDSCTKFENAETIENTLEFLAKNKLHRTIRRFTDEDVDTSGIVMEFYNDNNEVIDTIQIAHGEVVKTNNQYFKTYTIKKECFKMEDLQNILNIEQEEQFKLANEESFNEMKNSSYYQDGTLYLKMSGFTSPSVQITQIKGNIDYTDGGQTQKTLYFLKDELKNNVYIEGQTIAIPLKETIGDHKFYDFNIRFKVERLEFQISFFDILPEELKHNI